MNILLMSSVAWALFASWLYYNKSKEYRKFVDQVYNQRFSKQESVKEDKLRAEDIQKHVAALMNQRASLIVQVTDLIQCAERVSQSIAKMSKEI